MFHKKTAEQKATKFLLPIQERIKVEITENFHIHLYCKCAGKMQWSCDVIYPDEKLLMHIVKTTIKSYFPNAQISINPNNGRLETHSQNGDCKIDKYQINP